MARSRHVADRVGDQRAGADRIVVARDHVLDAVGVAVGVHEADDRNAQAASLAHGDLLGIEVDHEHRVRHALHVLHPAEVGLELGQVGLGGHALARGQQLELPVGLKALEVVQALDAAVDRVEVGEQPAQPAMVDVGHARALGHLLDGVAGLLLGPDEEDGPSPPGQVGGELLGLVQQRLGLEEVDDVDPVALAEDEAAHLGIPAARLVAEVDSGLQQLLDANGSHCPSPLSFGLVLPVRRLRDPGGGADAPCRAGPRSWPEPGRVQVGEGVYATFRASFRCGWRFGGTRRYPLPLPPGCRCAADRPSLPLPPVDRSAPFKSERGVAEMNRPVARRARAR